MASLPSNVDVFTALAFVVPGFIIARTREQFIAGRKRAASEDLLEYVTYGAVNFAVFSWLIYLLAYGNWSAWQASLGWLVVLLLGPLLLGVLLGVGARREWMHKLLAPIGIKAVHVVPAAWDWKFGKMPCQHALVTFKDGTRIGCFLGDRSFISSDQSERDLYAEQVFNIDDDGAWRPTRKSVLIAHGEISMIEFWREGATENGRTEQRICTDSNEATRRTPANGNGNPTAVAAE